MKILAFGEVMMRMMVPDYKLLHQSDELRYLFTGTGVNLLSGLYQMGEEVYLSTTLPDNAVGRAGASNLRKLGIRDDYLLFNGNHMGVYFLEVGYGNRASKVTYLNRQDSSFGQSRLENYDIEKSLRGMDLLHICGISLALGKNTREIALAYIRKAHEMKIKVAFDCNFRPSLWPNSNHEEIKALYEEVLKEVDIVFAGIKDATLLLDLTTSKEDKVSQTKDLLQQMIKQYHLETVLGTIRTEKKLQGYLVNQDNIWLSDEYTLTIYDRIGGGDAFAAGAIYGLLHHEEPTYLINYATVSGVLGHTTYGDSPVLGKEDIVDFLENGYSDVKR